MKSKSQSLFKQQTGFTIVELLIVLAIIGLLTVFGMPFMRGIIIQGKVEPTANDVSKIVTKMRGNLAATGGATPYAAVNTAVMSNTARGMVSSLVVGGVGAAATMTHDLGLTGAAVTVAPAQITVLGDSFDVTIPTANEAACPSLATQLNRSAEVITIGATVVKPAGGAYNAVAAQNACTAGDTNSYIFRFR